VIGACAPLIVRQPVSALYLIAWRYTDGASQYGVTAQRLTNLKFPAIDDIETLAPIEGQSTHIVIMNAEHNAVGFG
jgi:hypothetical protein